MEKMIENVGMAKWFQRIICKHNWVRGKIRIEKTCSKCGKFKIVGFPLPHDRQRAYNLKP